MNEPLITLLLCACLGLLGLQQIKIIIALRKLRKGQFKAVTIIKKKCESCDEIIEGINPKQLTHHYRIHVGQKHPEQYAVGSQQIKQGAAV